MTEPHSTNEGGPSAGFTLLEVLAVLVVSAMLVLMLGQGLRFGARAWTTYSAVTRSAEDSAPVERVIRALVERMDPGLFPEPPRPRGTAHEFVFATELPDPATGDTIPADVRVEVAGSNLVLDWRPRAGGAPFGPEPAFRRALLLDGVARLDMAYEAREGGAWRSSWTADALPGLVRLTVVPRAGPPWPPVIAHPRREPAEE